ncbi:MAG: TorF family putative porin [Verrucomicrobiota bacterium]
MKKYLIACGAASVALSASLSAQEVSVTTTFAWESSYVFRGVQLAEETYMPAVDFAFGDAYAGIWAAMPVSNEPNEVDFYAGYGLTVADDLTLDVGVTHYTYPDSGADILEDDSTTEIYVGTSFDAPFAPSVYAYYDFDLETFTLEGSAGHSIELDDRTTFDMSGALGYVNPDVSDSYTYAVGSVGLGYAINDYVSGSLYANYAWSSEDQMFDDDSTELWFGFSITGGF